MDLRQRKARGSLFALTLISVYIPGYSRAVVDCDDTPLAQAPPEAIRFCLKQAEEREAARALAAPYAAMPKTSEQERTQALRAAMAAAMPKAPAMLGRKAYPAGIYVYTTADLELKEGARRGKITYPLYQGTIGAPNGRKVYFVLSEASDREFAQEFGVMHSIRLGDVNPDGLDQGSELTGDGQWVFARDPGLVMHTDAEGKLKPLEPNQDYSPLQQITWRDRQVIVNVPMVKWGDGPGQQLIIDHGGCDPLIRRGPPSRLRVGGTPDAGGGPEGCERQGKNPLSRYRGGQALEIQILNDECQTARPWKPCGWVTMKLHQTIHRGDVHPYLTVFSASEVVIAEELGVPHTPKLAWAGRSNASPPLGLSGDPGGSEGVSSLVEFHNGVETWAGGPEGFQPGVISYGEPTWSTYSPMVHVTWAFFDCGGGRQHMTYWNVPCPQVAAKLAGSPQGTVYEGRLSELWSTGDLMITESTKVYGSKMHLVLNAPAPVAMIRR